MLKAKLLFTIYNDAHIQIIQKHAHCIDTANTKNWFVLNNLINSLKRNRD